MFGRFEFEQIAPTELQQRLESGEKLTVIDIREPFEWMETGVIPGAQLIPMGEFARGRYKEFSQDDELILVCAHGVRTADVAVALKMRGWKQAKSMSGGMTQWPGQVVPPEIEQA
jgi:sulfur-carrier protein adenylyltransferase/sulfurtransferase